MPMRRYVHGASGCWWPSTATSIASTSARRLRRISTTSHIEQEPAPAKSNSVAEKPVGGRSVSVGSAGALMESIWPGCRPSAVNRPACLSQETLTVLMRAAATAAEGPALLADDRPDEAHEDEDAGEQPDE